MAETDGGAGLAVVVVNFGSAELLRRNLVPLGRELRGATVIVVDNFTSGDERSRITRLAGEEGWTAVLSDTNAGFGAGMNRGVATAEALGASRFLLLNPDATISVKSVLELQQTVLDSPFRMVAPTIHTPSGRVWFSGVDLYLADGRMRGRSRRDPNSTAEIQPWLSGACLMVGVDLWNRVGGFADEYFLYWEDVDLSTRVLAVGGSLEVHPTATAVHDEGGTQTDTLTERAKSPTYYYYNIRNRLLFASLHLDSAHLESWLASTRRVSWKIVLQGGRRQLITSPRPVLAWLRGMRDGRRLARAEVRRRAAASS